MLGEYQLCPKCNGEKYIHHYGEGYSEFCTICDGKGIIARPVIEGMKSQDGLYTTSGAGDDLRFPNICTGDPVGNITISVFTDSGTDITEG